MTLLASNVDSTISSAGRFIGQCFRDNPVSPREHARQPAPRVCAAK